MNSSSRIRPRIGITVPLKRGFWMWQTTRLGVWMAGGVPIKLTAVSPQYEEMLDGLILSGGSDLHGDIYEGEIKPEYKYDTARDKMELVWLKRAEDKKLPVLGICRGAQLMNVHRGGTLHLDITKIYERAHYPSHLLAKIFYRKPMQTIAGSLIEQCIHCTDCKVNSMHTQAINIVGEGLTITAREPNGIVQSVEDTRSPYYLGVQFHPEFMIYNKRFRRIFEKLVESSKQGAQ